MNGIVLWLKIFFLFSFSFLYLFLSFFFSDLFYLIIVVASDGIQWHTHTHTHTHTRSVEVLWMRDWPVAETSTWQHTTLTTDSHPCHRRDSNPQSQHASGRRPTPCNAQRLASPRTPFLLIPSTTDYLQPFYHISPHFTSLTRQNIREQIDTKSQHALPSQ